MKFTGLVLLGVLLLSGCSGSDDTANEARGGDSAAHQAGNASAADLAPLSEGEWQDEMAAIQTFAPRGWRALCSWRVTRRRCQTPR